MVCLGGGRPTEPDLSPTTKKIYKQALADMASSTDEVNGNVAGTKVNIPSDSSSRLWTKGFIAILITQFMVALNDNLFRWLIIPIGKYAIGWSDNPDKVRTIGALVFLLPFLLLTSYAGFFCDRYDRRKVIIACKIAEVIIIMAGIFGILAQSVPFMLVILCLLGAQSAFFSPAKYSALPTIVPLSRISEANGYYSLTTLIACVGGQLLGGVLFVMTTLMPDGKPEIGQGGLYHWYWWATALMAVAIIGLVSSFFIPKMKPCDTQARFPLNPFFQIFADLRFLVRQRFLFWVAMGSSFFWGLGALAQLNIDKFGDEILRVRQDHIGLLLVALSLGLGLGAMLAGKWSRGRIELGMVPIGAFFITVFAVVLGFTPCMATTENGYASLGSLPFVYGIVGLILMGTSSGMFDIPLLGTLQTKSPETHRGRILAAYNFFSFGAMALFSVLQGILADKNSFNLSAKSIWIVCALLTVPVFFFTTRAFIVQTLDFVVHAILRVIYNPRIIDRDNIPETGGALLVSNHVSYIDALLIYTSQKRPVRFVANEDDLPGAIAHWICRKTGAILLRPGDRRSVVKAIRTAREALNNGEVVCIFAEGTLTRTCQMAPFKEGFLSMLKGVPHHAPQEGDTTPSVPIVPVFIGGMWGSYFTELRYRGTKRKISRLTQRPTVAFGKRMFDVRQKYWVERAVEELGVDAMNPARFPKDRHFRLPAIDMLYNNRRFGKLTRFADSTGTEMTGRGGILRMLIFRRLLRRLIGKDEKNVGLLLPSSIPGMLANAALTLDRRVPINLNFTTGSDTLNYCCDLTDIRHIVTSRKFLQKVPNLNLQTPCIILEDAAKTITVADKIIGLLQSLLPTCCLVRLLGLHKVKPDDTMTIVFTSGSTGRPKGVVLSHMNVAWNVSQFVRQFNPQDDYWLMGALPLFHSFGFSTTIWCPLVSPLRIVYHYSPLDPRVIGQMCRKYLVRIFVGTPTFFRLYLRKCQSEDFNRIYINMAGAEKLPADLAEAWKNKFGQELVEGFGATELSPVLTGDIPEILWLDPWHKYSKVGSIGVPMGGLTVRITDPETGEELGPNTPGMLEVKGPNVMQGYFNAPEQTAKVLRDGWYATGDIAKIDDDRFIFITGRLSRISKIGGEMVPHIRIEEEIERIITAEAPQDDSDSIAPKFSVTAVPDPKKGERIVVLYTELPLSPEEICRRMIDAGLPQIWVPAAVDFHQVENIPLLGTGKPSLKEISDLAKAIYAP